jgi:hypothetical protein
MTLLVLLTPRPDMLAHLFLSYGSITAVGIEQNFEKKFAMHGIHNN